MTNITRTILLIDDSEIMLRHVEKLLTQAGHAVVTANTMAGGLEAWLKVKPHAVLTDFVLDHGHTGLELLAAVFSLSPADTGQLRSAILTTGALTAQDQKRAAELGIITVQKPVLGNEQLFVDAVAAWLKP